MSNTPTPAEQVSASRQSPPLYHPPSDPLAARPEQAGSANAAASRITPGVPRAAMRQKSDGVARFTRMLGWFSVGLGAMQLFAPRAVARATGVNDRPLLVRAVGAREIASGVGILSQSRQGGWLWSRVAGDAMDLALLGSAVTAPGKSNARRRRVAVATAVVAGIAIVDLVSSWRQSRRSGHAATLRSPPMTGDVDVEKSITINRTTEECYRYWRDFRNLPRFMKHLEEVQVLSDSRSHWRASAPAGISVEWDAELTEERPGELLAWRSLQGADIDNAGSVRFERASGGRGTVVRLDLQYKPPGGKAGARLARLFGEDPALQIDQDLRRFKQLIETGEIATTVGQSSGPRGMMSRLLFHKGEPG